MRLVPRGKMKPNGAGDIVATISILDDDGKTHWEDVVNLSKEKSRAAFVAEVAERTHNARHVVAQAVMELLDQQREVELQEEQDREQAGPGEKVKKADQLVAAFMATKPELFHDQVLEGHVALVEDDHRAIYRLGSRMFKLRLAHQGYKQTGEIPSGNVINDALNVLGGMAVYANSQHRLHVRVAWDEGCLYYDLGDWRAVSVSDHGWEVVDVPPLMFRRFAHQKPQVEPESGGDLRDLLPLINITDTEGQLLFLVDLVAGMVPEIPRPLSIFHGAHGSAKTTAMKMKRELQDPAEVPLVGMPRDPGHLAQLGSHTLCLFLDNISTMPDWLSDAMSRFCTGDGFMKRALYTDDDDVIFKPMGIGGINGINLVVTAADLLDRSLVFQLHRVSETDRLEEAVLWRRFNEARPQLLGAMFSAYSEAMSLVKTIEVDRLPRLADYYRWACSVAVAIGYSISDYEAAWAKNQGIQDQQALDASPVAEAVLAFMEDREEWDGTAAQLLSELNQIAEKLKIDTKDRAWPSGAAWVTRRLNLVMPNLAQVGVQFWTVRDMQKRRIYFKRSENAVMPSLPSCETVEGHDSIAKNAVMDTQNAVIDDSNMTANDSNEIDAVTAPKPVDDSNDGNDSKFSPTEIKIGGQEKSDPTQFCMECGKEPYYYAETRNGEGGPLPYCREHGPGPPEQQS